MNFSVRAVDSEVILVWSMQGWASFSLPAGLQPAAYWNTSGCCSSAGVAFGAMGAGSYHATISSNGPYEVSAALYAVADAGSYYYIARGAPETSVLTLPPNAVEYIVAMATGGLLPVAHSSLGVVDEASPSAGGGQGDLIGRQSSPAFNMTTTAGEYGIAAVGVYAIPGGQSSEWIPGFLMGLAVGASGGAAAVGIIWFSVRRRGGTTHPPAQPPPAW